MRRPRTCNIGLSRLRRAHGLRSGRLPMAVASKGQVVLLLDDQLPLVAPGDIGEIAVKAARSPAAVAKNPELTAEKFLAIPESAGMQFRTGDLARINSDGLLTSLGARDRGRDSRQHDRSHRTGSGAACASGGGAGGCRSGGPGRSGAQSSLCRCSQRPCGLLARVAPMRSPACCPRRWCLWPLMPWTSFTSAPARSIAIACADCRFHLHGPAQ